MEINFIDVINYRYCQTRQISFLSNEYPNIRLNESKIIGYKSKVCMKILHIFNLYRQRLLIIARINHLCRILSPNLDMEQGRAIDAIIDTARL